MYNRKKCVDCGKFISLNKMSNNRNKNTFCKKCKKYICFSCIIFDYDFIGYMCNNCFCNVFKADWEKVNIAVDNDLNKLKMSLGYLHNHKINNYEVIKHD